MCARDVDAFGALYARYELRIFNFLFRCVGDRALAEDLLQETFWRLWQAARTFDPARGEFRSWLYRVALNVTLSELGLKHYSRESHPGTLPEKGTLPTTRESPDDPERRFERKEAAALVSTALADLSLEMREVVVLRCLEGMRFSEIALVTGATAGTLKTRFHRAVVELRRRLVPEER